MKKSLFEVFRIIGITSISNGKVTFDIDQGGTFSIIEVLENYGYNVKYEGKRSKLGGTPGVYYLE